MAIVHKFNVTEEDYFDYALDYLEAGRLFESLEMVGRCLDIDPDGFDFGMLRARILYEMELYDDALKQYYNLFIRYSASPELYLGILQALIALDYPSKAIFFLERLVEMELDDNESDFLNTFKELGDIKGLSEMSSQANPNISLVEIGKEEYEQAQKHIKEANFDQALNYLREVSSNSRYYSKAIIDIAIIMMSNGKHDKAIICIDRALLLEPDNIHFLLTKCMYYYLTGNQSAFDTLVKKIESYDFDTLEDLILMTSFGMEMNNHAWVAKYGEAIFDIKPYHRTTIHYLMQAYHNLGAHDEACEKLAHLLKIDHNDYVIKYYSHIIKESRDKKLEYSLSLTTEDVMKHIQIIVPVILFADNFDQKLSENGGEVFLEWYFAQKYAHEKKKFVTKLGVGYINFIRLQLIIGEHSFGDMLILTRRLLALEQVRSRDYTICIGDELYRFEPKVPRFVEHDPNLLRVYLDLFATLSLFNDINETKLNKFFKLLIVSTNFKLPSKIQMPSFLAAFYFQFLVNQDDEVTIDEVSKLFETDKDRVLKQMLNIDLIGDFEY